MRNRRALSNLIPLALLFSITNRAVLAGSGEASNSNPILKGILLAAVGIVSVPVLLISLRAFFRQSNSKRQNIFVTIGVLTIGVLTLTVLLLR